MDTADMGETLEDREARSVEALATLIDDWSLRPDHVLAVSLAEHLRANGVRNPSDPHAPGRIKARALRAAADRTARQAKHDVLETVGNPPHHCVVCQTYRQVAAQLVALAISFEGGAPDA